MEYLVFGAIFLCLLGIAWSIFSSTLDKYEEIA